MIHWCPDEARPQEARLTRKPLGTAEGEAVTPAQLAVLADHLRSILSEQDAADVMRWAQHPEAVRELLLHDPLMFEHDAAGVCPRCDAVMGEAHNLTSRVERTGLRFSCPVAAAWRALSDPRGAADVERAHEEALLQNVRLFPQFVTNGEPNDAPLARLATALWRTTEATLGPVGGLGADEQLALYGRHMYATPPFEGRIPTDADMSRLKSDARGMEAVEDEARLADRMHVALSRIGQRSVMAGG